MPPTHQRVTGLSGNEIYCLNKLGLRAGQLCVGNSVVSIGFAGGIGAGLSTLGGGEVEQITKLVHSGRMNAFDRMMTEARNYGGTGLTGVSFDMINHGGNLEFITVGSTLHQPAGPDALQFSTAADAQELYCQMDAEFQPLRFVFGNVAYSIGLGGSLSGAFTKLSRGEVPQYTKIFDETRHLALTRIMDGARQCGANSVVGIQTTITPLMGAQEMMMVGTASKHAAYGNSDQIATSDMTNEEMWNMANMGYLPLRLVMGVSVYSLGLKGGILSTLQSFGGGEVQGLTELLYEAREKALARIEQDAERFGADEVIGVKTRVYDLGGGLVEFLAIGTAVKKFPNVRTKSDTLPPQAIIQDRETFVDSINATDLGTGSRKESARRTQGGPISIIVFVLVATFYILRIFVLHR
jgi:uncharacterized protein YbjQ (UPF0145 family)